MRIAALIIVGLAVSGAVGARAPRESASDRVARLVRTAPRDAQTGYLRPVLDALRVPVDSQLLVFSKTGVQHAQTGPLTPRALYFNESVVVGYVAGAPEIEVIAHDPLEGLAFYTIDQSADTLTPTRRHSCLTCHETARTMDVPGLIVRSHTVDEAGSLLMTEMTPANHDVTHVTPHPERWGGWFVTLEGAPPPYGQRGHQGNITFTPQGHTSSQVFVDWIGSAPEKRGYLLPSSDIVSLLAFDHQMPAINLMTKLSFQARRGADVQPLARELADYLLFTNEAALPIALKARPGFAEALASRIPSDQRGRSLAELDLDRRLLRYPCSYMVYADAFEDLPPAIKQLVYQRMIDTLTRVRNDTVLEILRATKADFPKR